MKEINGIKIRKYPKMTKTRLVFIVGILLIPLIHFGIFYVYVNFSNILMAFWRFNEQGDRYWTFENFILVIKSFSAGGMGLLSLRNSLIYFAIETFNAFIIGSVFAYFSYKNLWLDTTRRVISAGLGLMSGVVVVNLIQAFFNPGGIVSDLFTKISGATEPIMVLSDSRYANKGLFLYDLWFTCGMNLYIRGAMMRIPNDVIEYSKLDGVTWVQELTKIIIPMIWPTIVMLLIMQVPAVFNAGVDVYIFTNGDYNTSTIAYWIWQNQLGATTESNSLYFCSAIGITIMIISIPLVFGTRSLLNKNNMGVDY